jgi:hypothetical protein
MSFRSVPDGNITGRLPAPRPRLNDEDSAEPRSTPFLDERPERLLNGENSGGAYRI